MLFEQGRIEAELGYARFLRLSGRADELPEVFANRVERGRDALAALDRGLSDGRAFVTGDAFAVADIALYAYVHCAHDAGVDERDHGAIAAWLDRVQAQPRFENDLEPIPAHARQRPL
ncbi:MAG: glutathione S-transferase C-terminal domain-containing protein [Thermoleophilaceae bacterium]|nr:glutathione S-transferase C-terminal domain-containing protein [Thermoleophilaceae bacterium]